MCLLLLSHRVHPQWPLVVAANRDEYYDRPTAPLARWVDAPGVHAGRDLRGGGSWLGVTADGRWAALTNVREPGQRLSGAPSRGAAVRDFLSGRLAPSAYLHDLAGRADRYNGFNLLAGDGAGVWYLSNRGDDPGPREVGSGIHGLSNAGLDTPWPKVARGKDQLRALLARPPLAESSPAGTASVTSAAADALVAALFERLTDRRVPPDRALPDTGVGLVWERRLGSAFVVAADYGTRSSTVLLRDAAGEIVIVERAFVPASDPPTVAGERRVYLPGGPVAGQLDLA